MLFIEIICTHYTFCILYFLISIKFCLQFDIEFSNFYVFSCECFVYKMIWHWEVGDTRYVENNTIDENDAYFSLLSTV